MCLSCSYDEDFYTMPVKVQLEWNDASIPEGARLRVELTDRHASVFVDSTDANGTAHFILPPGIYQVMSSGTHLTYDYRYIYNGMKSEVVIASDSTANIVLPLKVTKKRIVH